MASIDNPHYTAVILTKSGTKYKITDAMTSLSLDEQENGIAQKATVTIMQTKVGPKYITTLVSVHDQLYVYADTGSGAKEVFRGYIWEKTYQKDETKEFTMVAFDRLIYLQESEAYKFYPSGKTTKAIFTDICKDKGIKLSYNYSIKHAKLVIRGTLADAFTEDLLEEVRKKNGKRGIIRSTKGNIEVLEEGKGNKTVYKLYHGQSGNIISSKHTVTMSGITTKVIILGSEKDEKALQSGQPL